MLRGGLAAMRLMLEMFSSLHIGMTLSRYQLHEGRPTRWKVNDALPLIQVRRDEIENLVAALQEEIEDGQIKANASYYSMYHGPQLTLGTWVDCATLSLLRSCNMIKAFRTSRSAFQCVHHIDFGVCGTYPCRVLWRWVCGFCMFPKC
jgi:hypothetical protein